MKRSKTSTFVLKLSLVCEDWQQDYLDKVFRVSGNLYNNLVADRKKALKEMEKTREWRSIKEGIAATFREVGEGCPTEDQKAALDDFYARKKVIMKAYGFNEYAFQARARKWREHHKSLIHSQVAQKIASSVWQKFEAYFFGTGKEIHFQGWEHFFSIEGKNNSTGVRFLEAEPGKYVMRINKVDIPVNVPDTPYVQEAIVNRVKFCCIKRTPWHGKHQWLYSLNLVLEGEPPAKERPLQKGPVGIDIGTQTIAVAGDFAVMLEELAPGANTPHAALRRINRAMDRSRRATNPEMFREDGTIRPINKLPPECVRDEKRLWKDSNHYKKLRQKKRYLFAKLTRIRKCQHNELANRIRALGDDFFIETMNFSGLQKKAKPAVDEEGKNKRRKRFGKSIANKAPAALVNTIEKKVKKDGGHFNRVNTQKAKASQYDHTDNCYHKKKLSQRWAHLQSGEKVQRDLYSALLLQNTNTTLDGFIQVNIEARFHNFMRMHDAQIEVLKHIPSPGSTGVKCIA